MKQEEARMVATLAANHVLNQVREQFQDMVHYETMKVLPVISPEKLQPKPIRTSEQRCYVAPPSKPKSNFGQILMQCAAWQHGKSLLDETYLEKAGTRETLLVQQYDEECSVLRRDESQPSTHLDAADRAEKLGKSVWVQFETFALHIDQLVPKLLAKGWTIKPRLVKAQLTLLDDSSA